MFAPNHYSVGLDFRFRFPLNSFRLRNQYKINSPNFDSRQHSYRVIPKFETLGFRKKKSQMSSSSGRTSVAAGDLQMVPVAERAPPGLPPRHPLTVPPISASSSALVEYKAPAANPEDEDLEIKLRRILECVPVRVSNTSGSSAGSGSGDFHQYRQMRRKEQDRLARMDVDFLKRKEATEFAQRRDERLKAAEERTAKKRLKRQKKKQRKKGKKTEPDGVVGEEHQKEQSSDEDGDSDNY
ncbi:hypothetical protein ABFX02_02G038700 [Erythranthe guttata]